MILFDTSLAKTFTLEGMYADIKGDPGGKTRYGITEKVARSAPWHYEGDMKVFPKSLAINIYLTNYFSRIKGFKLKWQEVADQVFDHAVNCGVSAAGKILQRAINITLNKKEFITPLKVDGKIGSGTLSTLYKLRHKGYFLSRLIDEREKHYDKLALNPLRRKFIKSWRRRPVSLLLMDERGKYL